MQLLVFFLVLPYLIIVLLNPLFVLSISLVFVVFKTSVVGLQLDVLLLHSDESILETHDDDFEFDVLGVDLLLLVEVRICFRC